MKNEWEIPRDGSWQTFFILLNWVGWWMSKRVSRSSLIREPRLTVCWGAQHTRRLHCLKREAKRENLGHPKWWKNKISKKQKGKKKREAVCFHEMSSLTRWPSCCLSHLSFLGSHCALSLSLSTEHALVAIEQKIKKKRSNQIKVCKMCFI